MSIGEKHGHIPIILSEWKLFEPFAGQKAGASPLGLFSHFLIAGPGENSGLTRENRVL
jgi:hypothetical protein